MRLLGRGTVSAALIGAAMPGHAGTLRDALIEAYKTNPTINAARANQRGVDENVPIARSRGLPTASVQSSYQEFVQRAANAFTAPERQFSATLNLSVPIYQGGAVKNAVRAAETRVVAGQANLRDTEASLFAQVVGAYMDVIRDSAIVALNQKQVNVLKVNLEATKDRFQVGDLTRTDIAQSESRLAFATGQLQSAEAQLISSKETYIRLVGTPPDSLEPPPPLPNLPATPDGAVDIALEINPALLAAKTQRDAARYDTNVVNANRLPRLSAVGSGGYIDYLGSLGGTVGGSSFVQSTRSATVGLQATIPLFQGGLPGAQVRQAQAAESQAIENVTGSERSIIAQTRASYASWRASNELIVSSQAAVSAGELSLEGVRAENSVGTRTILDILNAEQELLNAQVNLVSARRNAYVAGFSLLAAMGRAGIKDLGLDGGIFYDPNLHYDKVKHSINDFGRDPTPAPVSTRTVDTPAQTPALINPDVR